jgi:pimeloyl-ACP methyl ester carboxylesterase
VTLLPAQTSWDQVPEMTGSLGQVQLPDVRLAAWDTGGDGAPVVLLHPHTGHGGVWGYQQAVFAAAGHRVISYSRRGYHGSEAGPADRPGTAVGDLVALLDELGVGQFHLVGLAAGGFAVFDAALAIPDRLLSCTVGSTLAGIQEPAWVQVTEALVPAGFRELPHAFQELGPSYRAAEPAPMATWREHAELSKPSRLQPPQHQLLWPAIESIAPPTLLLTGTADLYLPPSRLREIASHLPSAEVAVFAEAGHCPHWESYESFNDTVLSFLRRHGR